MTDYHQELHERVSRFYDRVLTGEINLDEVGEHPDFIKMMDDLMELDVDDLLVLTGMAIQDLNIDPTLSILDKYK